MSTLFLNLKEDLSKKSEEELLDVNHEDITDNIKEFLRTDLWEFEFISRSKVEFIPTLYKTRLYSIELIKSYDSFITRLKLIEARLNLIEEKLKSKETNLDLANIIKSIEDLEPVLVKLNFSDRDDQVISKFISEWINNSKNVKIDGVLIIYNTSRNPIRKYTFHNLRPINESGVLNLSIHSDDPERILTDLSLAYDDIEIDWEPTDLK